MKTTLLLSFLLSVAVVSVAQMPVFPTGFLPSIDGKYAFFAKTEQHYYLVSLPDTNAIRYTLDFDPENIPQLENEGYKYTVDTTSREIEFYLYDLNLWQQQYLDSGRVYDRAATFIKTLCYRF